MAKVISEGIGEFYRYTCGRAMVLTVRARGKDNAMAVGWHMPISTNPPLYGLAMAPGRFTYELIVESKEFGINFLPFGSAQLVDAVGSISGRNVDKFQRFGIITDKSVKTAVPILKDAYAACECRLVDDRGCGDSRLLVGEIVAAHLLRDALTAKKVLDLDKVSPLLFLGGQPNHYLTVSKETVRHVEPPSVNFNEPK